MSQKLLKNIGLFLLALVFSIGLMFAFTEIPVLLDRWMQSAIGTPHSDPANDAKRIELFYEAYSIRLVGYISLGIILALIVLGFSTKKTGLAWLGGVVLFLPVFATFAHSMFYLAGLGLFNVLLFPFLDISLALVDLGKIVLVPYWLLMAFFRLFNWYAHDFLAYFFMGTGAFLFVWGVFVWFQARSGKKKVASSWIYRFSRHPQYLGWILWSYGLMLYGPTLNQMKKSWGWSGTLPWLLSTMVIIGICMLEEIHMKKIAGKNYEEYRDKTPFLFPIPRFLKQIFTAPMRWVIRKKRPSNRKEVGLTVVSYTFLFILLSLFWVDFIPESSEPRVTIQQVYNPARADSLVQEILKEQPRRYRTLNPFNKLLAMGPETYPVLEDLMTDANAEVREFAVRAAGIYELREVLPYIVNALNDPADRVRQEGVRAIRRMEARETSDTLMYYLEKEKIPYTRELIIRTLSEMGDTRIYPTIEVQLDAAEWHRVTGALRAMAELDFDRTKPYLYQALNDERHLVRREVVYMLLEYLPPDAIPHLQKVTNDEEWEVRFYARQAIRKIEEKYEK
jgi:protein-S-isoprenylcysteine O-methyltransferase Ste14